MKLSRFNKVASICTLSILMIAGLDSNYSPVSSLENDSSPEINATGTISPNAIEAQIPLGKTVTIDRSITVSVEDIVKKITTSEGPDKLDILFLADNTDSMGDAIANVKANATSLLNSLDATYKDLQVGVARYYGDPQEKTYSRNYTGTRTQMKVVYTYLNESKTCFNGQGIAYPCYKYQVETTEGESATETKIRFLNQKQYDQYGNSSTKEWMRRDSDLVVGELGAKNAYQLQTSVNSDLDTAIDAINQWETGFGQDWAEGSFFALHQAASNGNDINGYSTGYNTDWRSDAKKVVVWFGDAKSHTKTVSQTEAINALEGQGIAVIAIHTKSTPKSETYGLNASLQASSIANATDGSFADVYSSNLSSTIETLIGKTVTETITTSPGIDLNFISQGDTTGLDVTYSCIDSLGCNNVKDGETRQFQMEVTANSAGIYNFQTVETTTNAQGSNTITTVFPD